VNGLSMNDRELMRQRASHSNFSLANPETDAT
jgi:hypothetical protein